MSKKQFVLYGVGTAFLIIVAVVLMIPKGDDVSNTNTLATSTRPFEPIATTSGARAERTPAVAAPTPEPFRFEIVTDRASQARGLSGRAEIPQNYGMLFVFEQPAVQRFWMKDMLAPIDIVWLRDDATVLKVEQNVLPGTYKSSKDAVIYTSPEPVRYVLETRAGETARLGIVAGTKINLPLPYGQ